MARPLLVNAPLTPAERKRIQRAKAKAGQSHETAIECHETIASDVCVTNPPFDYQAYAKNECTKMGLDGASQ